MEAAMPCVCVRGDKNSQLLDNLGWQMSPQLWWLVLDCHAAPPEKKKEMFWCHSFD